MVFHEGDTLAVRERAWKVIDLFVDSVGAEKLAIWWGLAPVALDSKQGQARIAKHKPSTLNNPSGFAMMFNLASGKPKPPEQWENNAQNFRLRCRIGHTEDIEYTDMSRQALAPVCPLSAWRYLSRGLPSNLRSAAWDG